jgi:hypothetical protein
VDYKNSNQFRKMEMQWLSGEPPNRPLPEVLWEIRFRSKENALAKVKELLNVVNSITPDEWSLEERVKLKLPTWFIDACAQPLSNDEMKVWLAQWRSLPAEAQLAFEEKKGWSLADWLHWMSPENRSWYVVNATEDLRNFSNLVVAAASWPTPLGAAKWMLRSAGAYAIEVTE